MSKSDWLIELLSDYGILEHFDHNEACPDGFDERELIEAIRQHIEREKREAVKNLSNSCYDHIEIKVGQRGCVDCVIVGRSLQAQLRKDTDNE